MRRGIGIGGIQKQMLEKVGENRSRCFDLFICLFFL